MTANLTSPALAPVAVDGVGRGWTTVTDNGTTASVGSEKNGKTVGVEHDAASLDNLIAALLAVRARIGDRIDDACKVYADDEPLGGPDYFDPADDVFGTHKVCPPSPARLRPRPAPRAAQS